MPNIIVVSNQKGGVGKTTTAYALLGILKSFGARVLGVDLDPQGNLGFSLGVDIEESKTVYDVFKKSVPIEQVIVKTKTVDIIPSNILLSSAEMEFIRPGRELLLKAALQPVMDSYDYIIIDTPPALSLLTVNAFVVANSIVIPMSPEVLSILGISQIKETIETIKSLFNPSLEVMGILLTRFNRRTLLARDILDMARQIAQTLDTNVFDIKIRSSVAIAEAPAHGEGLLEIAPTANATKDYIELAKLIHYGQYGSDLTEQEISASDA